MSATNALATFIHEAAYDRMPKQAIATAKDLILDTIGVALAASADPRPRLAVRYTQHLGASPVSSVIGGGFSTAPAEAAFCNALLAHALEYEDAWPETMHPTSMIFPAALSVAEQSGCTGSKLIEGCVVGLEVIAKIRRAAGNITHTRGWHASSVYGSMATAAAAAKILGLEKGQIHWALGIAASGASGLIRQMGTMAKWYNQGNAARQGVTAALLAKEGFTADEDIMDGHGGFMALFHDEGQYDLAKIAALGTPFHMVSPGVSIRKYPCAYVFHGPIDTLFDLMRGHGLAWQDVAEVVVALTPKQVELFDLPAPGWGEIGKFNLRFVLAAALRHGKVKPETFDDAVVADPAMLEAMGMIKLVALTPAEIPQGIDPARYQPEVSLRLRDGRVLTHRLEYPRGRYDDPTAKAEYVLPKFRENARLAMSAENVEQCIALVQRLDETEDLAAFTKLLRG